MNHKDETGAYRIEQLTENKLKDIETLYKAVHGHCPEKSHFGKKYSTGYTGVQYTGYIAYSSTHIPIAYFGVIPCFIQYKNTITLCAQAVDAMTLVQYRYKGLFVRLAKKTFDLCREAGIKLIFGFPNQNSYHGLVNTLGWKRAENMELFIIPLNSIPLKSFSQHFTWSKRIYTKYAEWILQKYSALQPGLANAAITEGFAGVVRDEAYLKYKTYSHTQVIKIGNAKIWIKLKNDLIIGDIDMVKDDFSAVINTIKKLACRLGLSRIFFQTSPGTKLHALFVQFYKSDPSFTVIFLDLGSDIPLEKSRFSFADIDIF